MFRLVLGEFLSDFNVEAWGDEGALASPSNLIRFQCRGWGVDWNVRERAHDVLEQVGGRTQGEQVAQVAGCMQNACVWWLGALFVYFCDSRDSRDLLRKKKSFLFGKGHKSRKSRESQEAVLGAYES